MIAPTSGPSKRKPAKLSLLPKEGDSGDPMDLDSNKTAAPTKSFAEPNEARILHSLPVVKGMPFLFLLAIHVNPPIQ